MLTPEELEALDNWRFQKRMPSRAAAVRELLKRGLAAEGFDLADGRSKSRDFGVTGTSTASPTRQPAGKRPANSPLLACLFPAFFLLNARSFGPPGWACRGDP